MKYGDFFEIAKRADCEFFRLKEDTPEGLRDLIRSIRFDHFGGCLPNDWIYEQISHAFDYFERGEDLDDFVVEADCYNSELYRWFGEPFASDCCYEYQEEFGEDLAGVAVYSMIASGQWLAKDRIYRAVSEFLKSVGEHR
jgi:hypothetical protein